MKQEYGCIGEVLKHSFSREIHNALADYDYKLIEIPRDRLDSFMRAAEFKAINVTIPYKERVIPFMDEIDDHAREIGAVNTVINRDGRLYGYNTDFYGMNALIDHAGIEVSGKKVAILGTGGTSKTARAVLKSRNAADIYTVSRSEGEKRITYSELYASHCDVEIIINTTPSGMYPGVKDSPIDLSKFKNLQGVIDAVYNPLRTTLVMNARAMGIRAEGGLYMLVAQAVRASELFLDTEYPVSVVDSVYKDIYLIKENLVLIGMPASGKSTVGKILAEKMGRELVDTDELITKKENRAISEIFSHDGENFFRDRECEAVSEASAVCNRVIATGGGAVLREENVFALRQNGRIYFIDRPPELLIPTDDRPLASKREDIMKRYHERYGIYRRSADSIIDATVSAEEVALKIMEDFYS